MKKVCKTKFIESLNKALYNKKNGMRDTSLIQRPLAWWHWKNVAPHMNFDGYQFERLFEEMSYKEWNRKEIQDLALNMVDYASHINAVLIDPNNESRVNVILPNDYFYGGTFLGVEKYHIVNV